MKKSNPAAPNSMGVGVQHFAVGQGTITKSLRDVPEKARNDLFVRLGQHRLIKKMEIEGDELTITVMTGFANQVHHDRVMKSLDIDVEKVIGHPAEVSFTKSVRGISLKGRRHISHTLMQRVQVVAVNIEDNDLTVTVRTGHSDPKQHECVLRTIEISAADIIGRQKTNARSFDIELENMVLASTTK